MLIWKEWGKSKALLSPLKFKPDQEWERLKGLERSSTFLSKRCFLIRLMRIKTLASEVFEKVSNDIRSKVGFSATHKHNTLRFKNLK